MWKGSVYKITRQMRMQQNSKDIYSSFWQFGVSFPKGDTKR